MSPGKASRPGWPPQEQGDLTVGRRLFGEVVVDDQGVLPRIPVVLADGAPCVGGDVLLGGGVAGSGRDHGRVIHGPVPSQDVHHLGDRRPLLPDGHVDAEDAGVLLVEDRVDADGGLPDLAVADDELPLPPADRGHGVDRLDPRVHGLSHGLAGDDPGRHDLDSPEFGRIDRPLAVDRGTDGVDHPSEHRITHRDLRDAAGPLDDVALLDLRVVPHDGDAHVVFLEVQAEAVDRTGELQHLHGHRILHTVDAGHAVPDREDHPGLTHLDLLLVILDLPSNDLTDLFCFDVHPKCPPLLL